MIRISYNSFDVNTIINQYKNNSIERSIINKLSSSSQVYDYNSLDELKFELNLRKNIVNASIKLNMSDFHFRTFRKSMCNTDYWERTKQGGFLLKDGIKSSAAINDIYKNSDEYGTECATAVVIIYYKACLDSLGEKIFDHTFQKIYLINWHYIDKNLSLNVIDNIKDYLPGDCRYFQNPQVNPLTPEWQGENVIVLGDGKYYGHGVGIRTESELITALNRRRIIGATQSAYLLDSVTRPDFKQLAYIYSNASSRLTKENLIL
ncbi:protein-glutamine gamma-glutamyltransferase [Clostridium sp. WILCCON 0269]|uniref:Protein-glutamine gamma-glutamyltransferase n=1 Tax=Candidatus Clostridium eludens TaxID=3381663 RepID=A0ABW8SE61_9CLOT